MAATSAAGATVREAVAVFHDRDSFQAAIDDLLSNNFDRADLSLLAGHKSVEEKLGHMYEKVGELEDAPDTPRSAYVERDSVAEARTGIIGGLGYVGALAAVGAIVASGGAVGWAIVGAVLAGGGGSAVGAWFSRHMGEDRAESVHDQLAKGGLLLWVRARDADHEARAVEILSRHSADDVHVHDLPAPRAPERDPLDGMEPDPFLPGARV